MNRRAFLAALPLLPLVAKAARPKAIPYGQGPAELALDAFRNAHMYRISAWGPKPWEDERTFCLPADGGDSYRATNIDTTGHKPINLVDVPPQDKPEV